MIFYVTLNVIIPHGFGGTYCHYLQGGGHRYPEDGIKRFIQNTKTPPMRPVSQAMSSLSVP
jgi:hypothetical protein